jgi:kinesin family protein 22
MVVDDQDGKKGKGSKGAEFGMELTNTESPNKSKRPLDGEIDSAQTPLKRQKRAANIAARLESDDDEWAPSAPTRKSKRKAIT